ncbi:MAG: polysaccharide biosynthesis/export family protein [Bacteroidetes bacterium]|nr:polysaccharide biosynthesis/export family protein [Bacteroidota bacterium]
MKLLARLSILVSLVIYFTSCSTQHSIPTYLETGRDTTGTDVVNYTEPTVQKNDLLSIKIYSASTDPRVDAPYNLLDASGSGATGQATASSAGFLVDANGNIEYPRLGVLHIEGLTRTGVADLIREKLNGQLTNPSVIVRFLNYHITVLGEVGHEGSYAIPGDHVTILEAIGLAGGIPITGKKTNVKVLRENNGKRETGVIDLTSKNVFDSPYYNLMQNDVVMVDITKAKAKQADQSSIQKVQIILGIVTSVALLYNIFK